MPQKIVNFVNFFVGFQPDIYWTQLKKNTSPFSSYIYKVVQIWPGLIVCKHALHQSRSYLNHLVAGFCVNFLYLIARIICPFDRAVSVLQRLKMHHLRILRFKTFGNGI